MYSWPWVLLQNTRPAAWSSFTVPMVIWSTVYFLGCWNRWFQPTSPNVAWELQSPKFCLNWPEFSDETLAVYAAYRAFRLG